MTIDDLCVDCGGSPCACDGMRETVSKVPCEACGGERICVCAPIVADPVPWQRPTRAYFGPRAEKHLELTMPWQDRKLLRAKKDVTLGLDDSKKPIEPRVVEGYARLDESLVFATKDPSVPVGRPSRGPDIVLEKGTVVEVMEPSPHDQADIDKNRDKGIQLVTIRWLGKTRLVRGSLLSRAHRDEYTGD